MAWGSRAGQVVIMKLLLAVRLATDILHSLAALGFDLLDASELRGETLEQEIIRTNAEILVVRSAKITRHTMKESSLALIVRAGSGLDSIDLIAASEFGIRVANCPGRTAAAVAELTFGLLISLDRQIVDNVLDLRNGAWNKGKYSTGRGLKGRTIGLAGLGCVGQAMIPPAQAFGMSVNAWSRSLSAEKAKALGIHYFATLAELATNSQILSLHLPLTVQTRAIVNDNILSRLPIGAYLINTARAELIDEAALVAAVTQQRLRVGLDVYHQEPSSLAGAFGDVVGRLIGVYGTHHIGASTEQAQMDVADEVFRILKAYKETSVVRNLVSVPTRSTEN